MITVGLLALLFFYVAYPDEKKRQREFWGGILRFFFKRGKGRGLNFYETHSSCTITELLQAQACKADEKRI
jgi:hypothetical protein